mmetsp:Transcript_34117/g.52401  ORF Transcript_34117/g.52401 Transcript_34117/m.52401 type:complete len:85 (+) Transcript_34117:194-448(+)
MTPEGETSIEMEEEKKDEAIIDNSEAAYDLYIKRGLEEGTVLKCMTCQKVIPSIIDYDNMGEKCLDCFLKEEGNIRQLTELSHG